MPVPRPDVLDFLQTRRSRAPKTLTTPAPDRDTITTLLTTAARCPDHKMLVPWRFLVFEGPALQRMAEAASTRAQALGKSEQDTEKARSVFANAPLVVGVVFTPKPSDAVPEVEQIMTAGGVCLSLVNAALASGWGAGWLTGWMAFDPEFCGTTCGLAPDEYFAGFVHLGTETVVPQERRRPDVSAITDWVTT